MSITVISIIRTRLLQVFFLALTLSLALGINYISAWTGPTATAPGNNAPSPINVSTASQVKLGNLSVGAVGNTATDYGLISYGKIRSTIGGVEFPDGSVQTSAGFTSANCTTSPELAVGWASFQTWAHGLSSRPTLLIPYLVNKVAEKGYAVGDIFYLGAQTGDSSNWAGVGMVPSSTDVRIIWNGTGAVNASTVITNKTGNTWSYITNTSWRFVVRACVI